MTDSTSTDSAVTDATTVASSAVASMPTEWVDRYVRLLGLAREAPSPAERDAAFQRHHVPTESWVASTLTLIRCEEDRVSVFRNGELTRFKDEGKHAEPPASPAECGRIAAEVFGLPNLPIAEAHRALSGRTG